MATVAQPTIAPIATITSLSGTPPFENSSFIVVINGSGFLPGATVTYGAVTLTPDSVTPTQIAVTVPAAVSLAGDEGVIAVAVVNPGQAPSNDNYYRFTDQLAKSSSGQWQVVSNYPIVYYPQAKECKP
jgi:hypothetical protein